MSLIDMAYSSVQQEEAKTRIIEMLGFYCDRCSSTGLTCVFGYGTNRSVTYRVCTDCRGLGALLPKWLLEKDFHHWLAETRAKS
jgi:hypothetical protein